MLKGTLDDFTLPDIFRLLSQTRRTGRLEVTRSAGSGSVFFRDGDVYYGESSLSKELLGRKLVRAKVITDGQLMRALDRQANAGGRLGDILLDEGLVFPEQLETALRSQIEDAVFDLLRWELGDFEWQPGEAIESEVALSVSVENLIMEASRRLDELEAIRRKIPSEESVLQMAQTPPEGAVEINITPEEWRVLVLVDGHRTVQGIAHEVGLDVFQTMRTLYGLVSSGLIDAPEGVSVPAEEVSSERPGTASPEDAGDAAAASAEEEATMGSPEETTTVASPEETTTAASPEATTTAASPEATTDAFAPAESVPADDGASRDDVAAAAGPERGTEREPQEARSEVAAATETGIAAAPDPGDDGPGDPFAQEILRPEPADDSEPAAATAAEGPPEPGSDSPDAIPVASQLRDEPSMVDKRAAVRELSNLFKQADADDDAPPAYAAPEGETSEGDDAEKPPARLEDDEEITRGLISRLIDGVKGL